jgi:multiple sugar transport system substrate-binding protein
VNFRSIRRAAGGFTAHRRGAARVLAVSALVCVAATTGITATASAKQKPSIVHLTEVDYYNSLPTSLALPPLLKACGKKVGASITRTLIPQANLLPQLLTDTTTHSYPNLALVDNPDVQELAATGALVPLKSISTKGLYPSIVKAGSFHGTPFGIAPGVNDLALYYNKTMFTAAGLTPPTTWAQLKSDASALTSGTTYGFAFSAPNEEEASWDFYPFMWSNGGSLLNLNATPVVSALSFVDSLVTDGSVSASVTTWTQGDVESQFAAGHAAMMENGPWELSTVASSGVQFGVVPFPAPAAGGKPSSPLGGEMWTVGKSSSKAEKKSLAVVQCLLAPQQSLAWSNKVGYMSADESADASQAAKNPLLAPFISEIGTAQARTTQLGKNYPTVSAALTTAIQSVLDGSAPPQTALNTAQLSQPS